MGLYANTKLLHVFTEPPGLLRAIHIAFEAHLEDSVFNIGC
jgi:hypothetical protein